METLDQSVKSVQKLTLCIPEWYQWRRSCLFIVNFWRDSTYIIFSIVEFEEINLL